MNICILIDGIANSGGTDRVATVISNIFTSKGMDVTIYSLRSGDSYYPLDERVKVIQPKYKVRIISLFYFVWGIKKIKYDAVIVISMGRLSVQSIPLLRLFRVRSKVICSDHVSFESFSNLIRKMKLLAYRLSDKVIVLTEKDKGNLKEYLGDKVSVIRNCSPYDELSKHEISLSNKENIVLAIGRLSYQKNFQRLLANWADAVTSTWRLIIVGDGEDREKLSKIIAQKQIDNVELVPANNNLSYWYSKASILAMTSRYEGLPMVLIEAKNFGLPVIAYDCDTGPKEIIMNDGFLINYNDDKGFVDKLGSLIDDDELRKEMSLNALENTHIYSRENVYLEWLRVLG